MGSSESIHARNPPATSDLKTELATAIRRQRWDVVKSLLNESNYSDLAEGCRWTQKKDIILNGPPWAVKRILPFCTAEQLDYVLPHLMARDQWETVGFVLEQRVSVKQHRWVAEEAGRKSDAIEFISHILPYCDEDELGNVLTNLVTRRLWKAVDKVLQRGVRETQHTWAVEEAIKHADDTYCVDHILPHCTEDERNSFLTNLVTRRLWEGVDKVLKCGVSDTQRTWAVEEAIKHADDKNCVNHILPHCTDDERNSVLTNLVTRGLWNAVDKVLLRGVSDTHHTWAVEKACEYANHFDIVFNILPHSTESERNSELRHLVTRRLWIAVGMVFELGVSKRKHKWAIEEAIKQADDVNFVDHILPHCPDDHLDSVLTHLVSRRLWEAADTVLERGVSATQRRWAVNEARKHADDKFFFSSVLIHCDDEQLGYVITHLVTRRLWEAVDKILQRRVSETQHRWAVEEASEHADDEQFVFYILPHCTEVERESVLTHLVKRRLWTVVYKVLQQGVSEKHYRWAVVEACRHANDFSKWCSWPCCKNEYNVSLLSGSVKLILHWDSGRDIVHDIVGSALLCWLHKSERSKQDDAVFWALIEDCRIDVSHTTRLFLAVKQDISRIVPELAELLKIHEDLCEVLYTSVLHQLCVMLCSNVRRNASALLTKYSVKGLCREIGYFSRTNKYVYTYSGNVLKITDTLNESMAQSDHCNTDHVSFLHFLQQFCWINTIKNDKRDDANLLILFAVLPLFPELQNVALRIMLRQNSWDIISQVCLSRAWEQDRRHLFQAAVKQGKWSVVKQWADHTLYDDQRWWALEEAFQNKQWEVYLLLADYGLTDTERMLVHNRLARYGDWDVVPQMFERGGDVAEVKERLGRLKDERRIPAYEKQGIKQRHKALTEYEKKLRTNQRKGSRHALSHSDWSVVLFSMIRNPSDGYQQRALKAAIKRKAWHVVRQLVRLGMDTAQKNSLFSKMMKRQQWDVCRVLLEQGLSVELCLKALPTLMEMNQWTLVARVMEHDVDDHVRQQVMQRALERNEGSVVWLCMTYMPTQFSEAERKALFQRALSCELWQIIKPLVEKEDITGIQHRDTALLAAIDQHQWDVVDHCDRHHADINMKDDEGHTPLQRAAMKEDWEAVEELVVRDADPNLLDSERRSVLSRAISSQQWDTVKLLIKYGSDIHKPSRPPDLGVTVITPLEMLINVRQVEILELSLMWCPGQSKWINRYRETVLHVMCLSGWWHNLQHMVARMKNPLAVTTTGKSVLMYAVLAKESPQRMVAECIRLGFAAHQPKVTHIQHDIMQLGNSEIYIEPQATEDWLTEDNLTSPFLCSVLRGMLAVAQMLCESGSCSNSQLFTLCTQLYRLVDLNTEEGRYLQERIGHDVVGYLTLTGRIQLALPYLQKKVSTPRSLQSRCRLVVSRCLSVKRRLRHVEKFLIPELLKKYILFSDIVEQACDGP